MLTLLAKLLKALNAEGNPAQVSAGFTLGLMVGLIPFWNPINLFIFFLVCIFRINFTAFFLSVAVCSGIAYLFDPLIEQLGLLLLTAPALQELWTASYNNDAMRLLQFNNTLVMGGIAVALAISLPFFFVCNYLVKKYRLHVLAWFSKLKVVKVLKATKFYRTYEKLSDGGVIS